MKGAFRSEPGRIAPRAKLLTELVAAIGAPGLGDKERQVFARRRLDDRAQLSKAAGATSLRAVAAALTARGIATARGGEWNAAQVANVRKREQF
jgi:hypothetical protein